MGISLWRGVWRRCSPKEIMARYTKESLDELKSRIDLAEVLGSHIELKRSGSSYKALCPFHDEKSPSFMMQKGDSHYHCFGCGAHGDAIQFLMQHIKMGFSDAVQHLADRFHVRLEQVDGGDGEKRIPRGRIKEALECACHFYQFFLLHTNEGKEPLEYLYARGLTLEFITSFRLGLAPAHEGLLRKVLHESGFSDEIMQESGLQVIRNEKKREFFLERITFPIQDVAGGVIGFSARKFREATYGGKYINTQETQIFKKSKVLFGLNYCRKRITKEKQAIIVEGQLDALRLIFAGFDFTVAGLGTAFGEAHVRELIQLGVSKVYLLLDGDEAGRTASIKIGQLFQKEGVEVFVASMTAGVDPDVLLLQSGPVGILQTLVQSQEYLNFLLGYFSKGVRMDSPAEKNQLLQEIVARIREWNNPIMVHESLKKLAHLANVPEDLLGAGVRVQPVMHSKKLVSSASDNKVDPDRILEADLLRWLILCAESNPHLVEICRAHITASEFRENIAEKLYVCLLERFEQKRPFDLLSLGAEIDDEELGVFLAEILSKKVKRERAEELLIETLQRIKERNWMVECETIKTEIDSGTAADDEMLALVKRFDELKRAAPKRIGV